MNQPATVFVVSDLHLGGPDGFRMCSSAGHRRLASFVRSVCQAIRTDHDVHLVLAGDIVDFLAEPDDAYASPDEWGWSAFCQDENLAVEKLDRIIESTGEVWDALAGFVAASGHLTLLLGNHDVELSLPKVRQRLLGRLAPRGGRLTFLYDNEAFTLGRLLVEHGNRYEGWNAVAHDALRQRRARLSRHERPDDFPAQPGSELVARVMNPIKRQYAFVDLLKPETGQVLPILAVLDPAAWKRAGPAVKAAARAAFRQTRIVGARTGTSSEFIGAAPDAIDGSKTDVELPEEPREAFRLADELAGKAGPVDERIGAVRDLEVSLLLQAFRWRHEKDLATFDISREADVYLVPARTLLDSGFDVVVFGHTHHVRHVVVGDRGVYLNTGTWADLMRLPAAIHDGEGLAALEGFLGDVRANRIDRYRRQVPTFARVDLGVDGGITGCGVFFHDDDGTAVPVTTQGVLDRLA